jgi:hypothetical protein
MPASYLPNVILILTSCYVNVMLQRVDQFFSNPE